MYEYNLYLTGSKSLPYLNNSNKDTDILILTEENLDSYTKLQLRFELKNTYPQIKNMDCRFTSVNNVQYIYYYELYFLQPIKTEHEFKVKSIFELKKQILRDCFFYLSESLYYMWYHCLTNIFIFENNSLEFTEKQKKELNLFYQHKKSNIEFYTSEKRKELMDRIVKLGALED